MRAGARCPSALDVWNLRKRSRSWPDSIMPMTAASAGVSYGLPRPFHPRPCPGGQVRVRPVPRAGVSPHLLRPVHDPCRPPPAVRSQAFLERDSVHGRTPAWLLHGGRSRDWHTTPSRRCTSRDVLPATRPSAACLRMFAGYPAWLPPSTTASAAAMIRHMGRIGPWYWRIFQAASCIGRPASAFVSIASVRSR